MNKLKSVAVLAVVFVSQLVPVLTAVAANGSTTPFPASLSAVTLMPPAMANSLLGVAPDAVGTLYLRVTAYTSAVEETDDTPFITANGTTTRDGIVATNLLPFGTKVMIPALFGDKVFTVEDRMAMKKTNAMDIWMPSRAKALHFGANYANVVVLGDAPVSPMAIVMAER